MKIKPLRYNSSKSYITKKYNKIIWSCGDINNLGTYRPNNSSYNDMLSNAFRGSTALLYLWRITIRDLDGFGSLNWPFNQYQHLQYKPYLMYANKLDNFNIYSVNNFSIVNDSNSSIYFGARPKWLIPNNGLKVWLKILDDRINRLNLYSGLLNNTYTATYGTSWYKPKGTLPSGGTTGMGYEYYRPYGFNVFVDYSTSAAGVNVSSCRYTHLVVKIVDIYQKTSKISKISLKDGVDLNFLRVFKSLRRTNTSRKYNVSGTSPNDGPGRTLLQAMNQPLDINLLITFLAKSDSPMNLNTKVLLYDSYYQNLNDNLYGHSCLTDNIYKSYNRVFCVKDKMNPTPFNPSAYLLSIRDNTANTTIQWYLDNTWRLYWMVIPIQITGIMPGLNPINLVAGRSLFNLDKFKLIFNVPRVSRGRYFYIDTIDAIVSLLITYSLNNKLPITVSSTLFNGNSNVMSDSRQYGYGTISQSLFIKRNCPPYIYKNANDSDKQVVNYRDNLLRGLVSKVLDLKNIDAIKLSNFRNTKIIYKVF